MRIVHINNIDLTGARFNGHDMQVALNRMGHQAHQFVFGKQGIDANTICIGSSAETYILRDHCKEFENSLSLQTTIYPFGTEIMRHEVFLHADVVHCHLIHNHFMSLYDFAEMSRLKPLVWTIHDPWAVTGHCVYPIDCQKWINGCSNCHNLNKMLPMREDNTALMHDIKKSVYAQLTVDVVVASDWMKDLLSSSPLTGHFKNVHKIPFGISTDVFSNTQNKLAIRKSLGINEDSFVMFFRSDDNEFKGLYRVKEMLRCLPNGYHITLLTVGMTDLLVEFMDRYDVIGFDWMNDEQKLAQLYAASDVFLMPSVAEAFGMMAIEAMACGIPVIVYAGTSLPSVTYAPACGIVVSGEDGKVFAAAVERLIKSPEERTCRGQLGRELAFEHYRFEDYVNRHIALYEDILERQ